MEQQLNWKTLIGFHSAFFFGMFNGGKLWKQQFVSLLWLNFIDIFCFKQWKFRLETTFVNFEVALIIVFRNLYFLPRQEKYFIYTDKLFQKQCFHF